MICVTLTQAVLVKRESSKWSIIAFTDESRLCLMNDYTRVTNWGNKAHVIRLKISPNEISIKWVESQYGWILFWITAMTYTFWLMQLEFLKYTDMSLLILVSNCLGMGYNNSPNDNNSKPDRVALVTIISRTIVYSAWNYLRILQYSNLQEHVWN